MSSSLRHVELSHSCPKGEASNYNSVGDNEYNLTCLEAVQVIGRARDEVGTSKIRNCFAKSKFIKDADERLKSGGSVPLDEIDEYMMYSNEKVEMEDKNINIEERDKPNSKKACDRIDEEMHVISQNKMIPRRYHRDLDY
ncbi:hypothetical protein RF11_03424 [Thelohanellus kitauei]|uniref:Uncharacterized protein n=1 Tax=Thelohanellus kitauei TaxID=669202 RepID=A0A0C2JDI5_THEKT|nr:hypothetical protein RF11_03424 [Thelohanellus kitauei]